MPPVECGCTAITVALSRSRHRAKVLGCMSPAVWLLAAAGMSLSALIPGAVASSPETTSLGSALSTAALLAVAGAFVGLAGSSRVLGTSDGLRVMNLFQIITLDARAVASVEVTRGLVIVTEDGRLIRSFAYGPSLVGDLVGYPRAVFAQQCCQNWLSKLASLETPAPGEINIVLRRAVWVLPAALLVAYATEVLLVRALA